MYRHIVKIVKNDLLGSNNDQCYIQNCVVMKHAITKIGPDVSRNTLFHDRSLSIH